EVLVELQPGGRGRYAYVFVHNNPVISSDSEGSLAGRSENREMFRSLNMTRFAIPRSTLPFCHAEICRQACRLPTLRMATGSGCPKTYRRHPIDHIFSGTSMPSNFKPRCRTRPVRSHSASRDERTGSSAFKTGQAS